VSRGSLRGRLALLFVVAGTVSALLVGLVVAALAGLDRAMEDRVGRYGPALLETETLARAYSDQETGLRSYLLAGRPAFLEPYREGRRVERASLRDLAGLLSERPDLVRRLEILRRESDRWHMQVARPTIARVRAAGPVQPSVVEVQAGADRFDRVRRAMRDLRRPVRRVRDESSAALRDNRDRLRTVLVVCLVGLVLVAVLTWRALRRWVVSPLRELGEEVDRVEGGDMARQVALPAAPQEIAALAEQVDRMRLRILQEYAIAEASRAQALAARALVEEQAADLRRSNAELEQFAYVASHDLQEPLRKVASFCQLLERRYKGQLDERADQYIEFAVDGAKRMQQLINDLLAFSRVGRMSGDLVEVDLEAVLAQALRQLGALIEEADAVITHDPLPVVCGDASLLVQLLQNLVGNGIKFRSDAPVRVHVGVEDVRAGMVELYCRDNGIGIEPQYEDKIFVIFQRLHGRDAYGGTGIGLAMCKKIVEFHGGRLWLDVRDAGSGDDVSGSTFRFTLPVPTAEGHDEQ